MRTITFILNIALLLALCFLLIAKDGLPSNPTDVALFILFITTPIVSLAYAALGEQPTNLFFLYIKRKSLEERDKIKQLEES